MRMDPTNLADVTGYTYTYLSGAGTYFDVRIPGLEMTVVQVDGQNIQRVTVEELRIAIAETYDVIVRPTDDRAYTVFAEAMDRSGYARGTLAPRKGMAAPIPARRPRPVRTMADMGMAHDMEGMEARDTAGMQGHDMAAMEGHDMESGPKLAPPGAIAAPIPHGPDKHGRGNSVTPVETRSRLSDPGVGLDGDGRRVLLYTDLKGVGSTYDQRAPGREIELHLTGNMERYLWSFDGKAFSQAKEPIPFEHGERLRLTFVNDTMMEHPIHLHGMWMELENGHGGYLPKKHTVNVKPAERLSVLVTADAPGRWAVHCHILYHMDMGMFRAVEVTGRPRAEARQ